MAVLRFLWRNLSFVDSVPSGDNWHALSRLTLVHLG